jgi:putative ABC transport system permease protein
VAIINDTLAARFFPGEDPIGHRFRDDYDGKWRTIVGLVASYKDQRPMNRPAAQVYRPLAQTGFGFQWITLRADGDPKALAGLIRSIVREIDPDVPVMQLRPMRQVVTESLSEPRMMTRLVGGFAAFALLLAAMGLYGVVAYSVRQRWHEMGIRIALGASHGDVLALVVRKGTQLALTGVILGTPLAYVATRSLRSLLYGITPHDPIVFISAPALMMFVALAASYLPARRAARANPMAILRHE